MGFYECIHDCGNDNYCVSIGSSLDNFESISWMFCDKHKLRKEMQCRYKLSQFLRRYSKSTSYTLVNVQIEDIFGKYVVMRIFNGGTLLPLLQPSNMIYFSQYNNEPSWKVDGNDLVIIDHFYESMFVGSPEYKGTDWIFSWRTHKILSRADYLAECKLDDDCV